MGWLTIFWVLRILMMIASQCLKLRILLLAQAKADPESGLIVQGTGASQNDTY